MSIFAGLVLSWLIVGFVGSIIHYQLMDTSFKLIYGKSFGDVILLAVGKRDKRSDQAVKEYPRLVMFGACVGIVGVGTLMGVLMLSMNDKATIRQQMNKMAKDLNLEKKD